MICWVRSNSWCWALTRKKMHIPVVLQCLDSTVLLEEVVWNSHRKDLKMFESRSEPKLIFFTSQPLIGSKLKKFSSELLDRGNRVTSMWKYFSISAVLLNIISTYNLKHHMMCRAGRQCYQSSRANSPTEIDPQMIWEVRISRQGL